MSIAQYKTDDGYVLEAFSSMYLDYGLVISKDGKELFYSPSCLCNESWGLKPASKYDDWDDAEATLYDGTDDDPFVPWTEEDWVEALKDFAYDAIEAYVGFDGDAYEASYQGKGVDVQQAIQSYEEVE